MPPLGNAITSQRNTRIAHDKTVLLSDDFGDDNRELMRVSCYAEYEGPIYAHLICEKCLLNALLSKKTELANIRCFGCKKLLNPNCLIAYINKVVFGYTNPTMATRKDTPHQLANKLIEQFIKNYTLAQFMLMLGIRATDDINHFNVYCGNIPKDPPLDIDASEIRKAVRNIKNKMRQAAANKEAPVKKTKLDGMLGDESDGIGGAILDDMPEDDAILDDIPEDDVSDNDMPEDEDDMSGNEMPKDKSAKRTRKRAKNSIEFTTASLYSHVLDFATTPLDDADYAAFLKTVKKSKTAARVNFLFAKLLFLMNNPRLPHATITRYLLPYIFHSEMYADHPLRNYVEGYRTDYLSYETNQEIVLEAMLQTSYPIHPSDIFNILVKVRVLEDLSTTRLLKFISRNARHRDFKNIRFNKSNLLFIRMISDIGANLMSNSVSLNDFLKIANLINEYPYLKELLSSLRGRCIEGKDNIYEWIKRGLKDKIGEMMASQQIVSLDGVFVLFRGPKLLERRVDLIRWLDKILQDQDMRVFYFMDLIKLEILDRNVCKEIPKLQYFFQSEVVLYLVRGLRTEMCQAEFPSCNFHSKVLSLMKNLQSHMEVHGRAHRCCILNGSEECDEIRTFFGHILHYNALLSKLPEKMHVYKIDDFQAQLRSQEYAAIFRQLCRCQSRTRLSLYREVLDATAADVFGLLGSDDIMGVSHFCLGDDASCSDALMKAYLEYMMGLDCKNSQKQHRHAKPQRNDFGQILEDIITNYRHIAYSAESYLLQLGFKSANEVRVYFKGSIAHLLELGFAIDNHRDLFYEKFYPFVRSSVLRDLIVFIKAEIDLNGRNIRDEQSLELYALKLLLGKDPIVPNRA